MTPTELRALADALEPLASLERSGSQGALALESTIAYLRAQADAQPVAKIERVAAGAIALFTPSGGPFDMSKYVGASLYTHPAPSAPAGWKWVPVEPTPEMLHAEVHGSDWNGRSGDERARAVWAAVLAAAPAVPQAEPKLTPASGDDLNVYKEMADNYRNDAQAEPKREPTCLWSRADDDTDVWETSCGHAFTIIEGTPSDNHMEFCCYCGRRVDEEIGGSDE